MVFSKSKIFIGIVFWFLYGFPWVGIAQDVQEDKCGWTSNKKAIKEYEKGLDKKSFGYSERMNYLSNALEIDPEFTVALWAKTYSQIKDATGRQKPYQNTLNSLKTVVEACPEIHSAPYFYLGEIYFSNNDYENAAINYHKFIHFKSEDESKFERKYDEQLEISKVNYELATFLADQYSHPYPFNAIKVSPLSTAEHDEYLPSISPDNEVMLYTRRMELKENERDSYVKSDHVVKIERFSVSNYLNGAFEKGQAFGSPFNTNPEANYGGATISVDNKELYFTVCEQEMGKMNCDIYYSRYGLDTEIEFSQGKVHWSKPVNLGPNINTSDGWEAQPTVSKDGNWLMYAVFREGTRGIDLFQSFRNPDGSWGPGESMGETINTAGDEKSPFFHSDAKTLYFASRGGHMGMGGYDVFMSRYVENKWTEPVNLGYPLNTPGDEHGYIVSLDGKTAYFGSSNPFQGVKSSSIDLFQVDLPKEIRPDKVMLVKGVVKTVTNDVPKDAVIEMRNTKTQSVENFKVDTLDGSFTAIVTIEDSADYMLTAKGKDLAFNNKIIKAPKGEDPIKTKIKVEVEKSRVGQHITIENIYFETNSANLNKESRASLDALIGYMKANPGFKISIDGHTDNVGDAKANLALSTDRAYTVMAYLQEFGIDASRLKFKGWGAAKPLVSNDSAEGRATNRRIEIVVLNK